MSSEIGLWYVMSDVTSEILFVILLLVVYHILTKRVQELTTSNLLENPFMYLLDCKKNLSDLLSATTCTFIRRKWSGSCFGVGLVNAR